MVAAAAEAVTMDRDPAATTDQHPLIRRLATIGLEPSHYVIFGSGPLLAHGIRTTIRDLDVVARGPAWHHARQAGLPATGTITGDPAAQFWNNMIMIFQRWITPDWNTDELISRAQHIGGLPYAPLTDVLRYKQILQRPKDITDIQAMTTRSHHRSRDHIRPCLLGVCSHVPKPAVSTRHTPALNHSASRTNQQRMILSRISWHSRICERADS
jgi:hypothetical protein